MWRTTVTIQQHMDRGTVVVVDVVDSHIQRIVLATEETTVTQQVSHRPLLFMSSQEQPSLREQYLLCKLYVRMRSANRFQIRMYYVAYYCDHTAAHGQGYCCCC